IDGNQGAVTAVFDGDRWAQVGDPVGRGSGLDCATTTHLVRLLEAPVPAGMTSPGSGIDSVIYRTEMRSLADGTVRELPGPDVDGSFGGAAVTLACGADHAVAASPGPNRSFVLGDEGWKVAEPPSSDDGKPMAPISV